MFRLAYRPNLKCGTTLEINHGTIKEVAEHYEFLCQRDKSNFECIRLNNEFRRCRYYFDVDYKGNDHNANSVRNWCCRILASKGIEVLFIGTYTPAPHYCTY
jgi:hypothetical protein